MDATPAAGGGGNGGGGGTASSWRYFDVSNISEKSMVSAFYPVLAKNYMGIVFSQMVEDWQGVSAVGVDGGAKININGNVLTWTESMALEGLTPEAMAQFGIAEITEEEFYTL